MSLITGSPAPAFSLYNSEKQEVTLAAQRGTAVVLLFFPLAFTSTCTKELCSVRDNLSTYNALKARVFGISCDSLYTLAKYKEEQRLNFDLLSDFNTEVSESYGCLYNKFSFGMKRVPKRAAFVISAEGILMHAEVLEVASELPDFKKIEDCLTQLAVA
jgi:glutaredoxin-dependent peroxiredoxin